MLGWKKESTKDKKKRESESISKFSGKVAMKLSEADTKAKLIDPALLQRGWTEDLIRREETECGIDITEGRPI